MGSKGGLRQNKRHTFFSIFNPQNLQRQIDSYGYYFSIEKYLLSLLAIVAGIVVCGLLFSLKWYLITISSFVGIVCLPGLILDGYKNMYEHKRFLDLSDYMEQILYSFKLNQKILTALKDTQTLFTQGRMQDTIGRAAEYIEKGSCVRDLFKEALELIEKEYPNKRLHAIHGFLQVVEKNGGSCEDAIDLLLEDKAIWADNILLLQEDKRSARVRILFALGVTMLLALVFHGMYRSMPQQYSIVENPVTQVVTAMYLISNILILKKANHELSASWLERDESGEEEKMAHYFDMVVNFDKHSERKKSAMMAAPFLAGAVLLVALSCHYLSLAAVMIGFLLLNQHKVGYRIGYNRVVKEINLRFPQWLMEMALLLQGNNVQVSIQKTVPGAPAILKKELKKMIRGLKEKPGSIEPYMEFLEMFQISSVQSAMKMLYSISESGNGDTQSQIHVMVQRNTKLLDKSEKLLNEKNLVGMNTFFYLPQITISFEMMVNMFVFMMVFLTQLKLT